jgi:hypothetical protein
MVSESFPDDTSLLITGSDKNSDLGISLQRTDLEINQKSSELDPGLMQEEQGIKALGDGYFIVPNLGEKPRTCSASFQHIKWGNAIL